MNYGGYFEVATLKKEVDDLNLKMNSADFWQDQKEAQKIINQRNQKQTIITDIETLQKDINSNLELVNLLKEEVDEEIKQNVINDLERLTKEIDKLEIKLLLNQKYDKNDAVFEIHSGAGGTEANDWVAMLYRMYLRYFEHNDYQYEILGEIKGDEVGYKSVVILVKGLFAYGYLKYEHGVHRLVRISPFDSNAKRHTSFASVDVVPYFNEEIDLEINEKDLKIDVYKSSGAGGQSVNTTDSAVRITHLPSKIVVTCQNERSQIKNKEQALKILKNKLWTIEETKKEESLKAIRGDVIDINFGSQIRSYVMHPYSMVKDHRTNTEVTNVEKVLAGDINQFINDNLKRKD